MLYPVPPYLVGEVSIDIEANTVSNELSITSDVPHDNTGCRSHHSGHVLINQEAEALLLGRSGKYLIHGSHYVTLSNHLKSKGWLTSILLHYLKNKIVSIVIIAYINMDHRYLFAGCNLENWL